MKNFVFILLTFFISSNALPQGWTEVGTGTHSLNANGNIVTLCLDTGNVVYAAGSFTDSPMHTQGHYYVAKWNGTDWAEVGTGLYALNANASIFSLCVDAKHNLYAAGNFFNADTNCYVAKWDGVTWSELGSGSNRLKANNIISTICADKAGNIYAAGNFTDSPTSIWGHFYVAKWDGTSWGQLGTGANALNALLPIGAITVANNGDIIAGVYRADSTGYYQVYSWNGAAWRRLGTLNAYSVIYSLCTDTAGNIYATGYVKSGGSYCVEKWDGSAWSELGTGSNALGAIWPLNSVCADPIGNIYTAGSYLGGGWNIERWFGCCWQAIGQTHAVSPVEQIGQAIVANATTVYSIGAYPINDSSSYISYVVKYDLAGLGVKDAQNAAYIIKVYPDPAKTSVSIEIPSSLAGNDFTICTTSGKKIKAGKFNSTLNTIDITGFSPGVYILNLNYISAKIVITQ